MTPKHSSIPMPVQAFRRRRKRPSWRWFFALALVAPLLIWLALKSADGPASQPSSPISASPEPGPPWQLGNPQGRFTLTFYADLECPFCRAYFPVLKRWVSESPDVRLQWNHMPLAAHEPAASTEARLVECAAETTGHTAFWQAVDWVYAHTRGDGQGLPEGARYPDLTPAMEHCLADKRPDAVVRTQTEEAAKSGVTATPSLRLHDHETGKAILLQGPVEGDALLSAMDMLAADEPINAAATAVPANILNDISK